MEALHAGHRYARDNYYYKYHYDSIQYLTMNEGFGGRQLGIAFLAQVCRDQSVGVNSMVRVGHNIDWAAKLGK